MAETPVKPSYLGLLNAIAVAESNAHEYLRAWIAVEHGKERSALRSSRSVTHVRYATGLIRMNKRAAARSPAAKVHQPFVASAAADNFRSVSRSSAITAV